MSELPVKPLTDKQKDAVIQDKLHALRDALRDVEKNMTVKKLTIASLESIVPLARPATLPLESYTIDESPTNVEPTIVLLNRCYKELVLERFESLQYKADTVAAHNAVANDSGTPTETMNAINQLRTFSECYQHLCQTLATGNTDVLQEQIVANASLPKFDQDQFKALMLKPLRNGIDYSFSIGNDLVRYLTVLKDCYQSKEAGEQVVELNVKALNDIKADCKDRSKVYRLPNDALQAIAQMANLGETANREDLAEYIHLMYDKMKTNAVPNDSTAWSRIDEYLNRASDFLSKPNASFFYVDAAKKLSELRNYVSDSWQPTYDSRDGILAIYHGLNEFWSSADIVLRVLDMTENHINQTVLEMASYAQAFAVEASNYLQAAFNNQSKLGDRTTLSDLIKSFDELAKTLPRGTI